MQMPAALASCQLASKPLTLWPVLQQTCTLYCQPAGGSRCLCTSCWCALYCWSALQACACHAPGLSQHATVSLWHGLLALQDALSSPTLTLLSMACRSTTLVPSRFTPTPCSTCETLYCSPTACTAHLQDNSLTLSMHHVPSSHWLLMHAWVMQRLGAVHCTCVGTHRRMPAGGRRSYTHTTWPGTSASPAGCPSWPSSGWYAQL